MKKLLLSAAVLLSALTANAVDYLVQTGKAGDPEWDASVVSSTGATLVDLTEAGQSVDAWLTATVTETDKEIWFAGGTYTFAASYANKANTTFVGGFSGMESSAGDRMWEVDAPMYEFETPTVFDGNNTVKLFTGTGKAVLDGITFQNSSFAGNAGLIRLGNGSAVRYCKFLNNKATTKGGQGGALQMYNAGATIEYSYFEGNAGGQGAAIYANCNTQVVTVKNCYFKNNSINASSEAANGGGAIHFQNGATYTIDACYFVGNNSGNNSKYGNGDAISFAGTNANNVIKNCVIEGCTGVKTAVYMAAGKFVNNTVVENAGGAIYATAGTLQNNIFWGSTSAKAATALTAASLVKTNNAAYSNLGDGNISIDTLNVTGRAGRKSIAFADPANHDFHLTAISAAVGAGAADATIEFDYTGESRNNPLDLGAYNYTAPVLANSYYVTGTVGGDNWTPNKFPMSADGVYVFENHPAGKFQMKVTRGDWSWAKGFSNLDAANSSANIVSSNDGNIMFYIDRPSDLTVQVVEDGANVRIIVLGSTVAMPTHFIAGNGHEDVNGVWCNGKNWSVDGTALLGDSIKYANLKAGFVHQFKVTNGTWTNAMNITKVKAACRANFVYGTDNITFQMAEDGPVVIRVVGDSVEVIGNFLDPNTHVISSYTIVGDAALMGEGWAVNCAENNLVDNEGTWTLAKVVTLEAGDYWYKVVGDHSYSVYEYPGVDQSQKVTVAVSGTYNVTFTWVPATETLTITMTLDNPTALEQVEAVEAKKVMLNGQLVIVKGEKMYNALGQEVN